MKAFAADRFHWRIWIGLIAAPVALLTEQAGRAEIVVGAY